MADKVPPAHRKCGTMPVHERLLRTNPAYIHARAESETRAWQYKHRTRAATRTGVTVIPVVVHVVYKTDAQNISDEQIQSQIAVLNRDFRKSNTDVGNTPAPFQSLCADARIEFELAKLDPKGKAHSGINRVSTTADSFSDDDRVKSAATGGANAWPADEYLNLWVCQLGDHLLGYAQFPGGPTATDGVVILHSAFGTTGTATAPFNLGRTTTHEVGHWLNLRHIWGDDGSGCNGSDLVDDTPNAGGPNYGTPTFPHTSCDNAPNGDLFCNYMDYVDDNAMFMFTHGQVVRMQACLDSDRSTTGHSKPAPSLTFVDSAVPTIATLDQGTTLAVFDQPYVTLASLDAGGTLAGIDFVKYGFYDKPPYADTPKIAWSDTFTPVNAGDPMFRNGGSLGAGGVPVGNAMPFVLATPHHSMAWTQSFPALASNQTVGLAAQIQQLEQALRQYTAADAAGKLSAVDAAHAEQLKAECSRLHAQYRQFSAT